MSESKRNLIAGRWQAGDAEIEERNPSDLSDLVGVFAQASTEHGHYARECYMVLKTGYTAAGELS